MADWKIKQIMPPLFWKCPVCPGNATRKVYTVYVCSKCNTTFELEEVTP